MGKVLGARSSRKPEDNPAKAEAKPEAKPADTPIENRHLTLAALYLEQGRDEKACWHLSLVVEQEPNHRSARFYYAELLDRLRRHDEAREQFEEIIARLQDATLADFRHLIHCHGRLVDIADAEASDYRRHLHRGIALYWLAQAPAATPEEEDLIPAEALLCKAAAALQQAQQLEPREARPCWYLYKAWRCLGQQQHAKRHLTRALDLAPFSHLTPAEQRGLFLASQEE